MNMKGHLKAAFHSFRIIPVIWALCMIGMSTPAHAGLWDWMHEWFFMRNLAGKGRYVEYQRPREIKAPLPPLEVITDGFKMVRVYQDFPGSYMVEWTWRVSLKNISSREVEILLEYTLQDEDDLLVASSKDTFRRIAAGESVTVEKTDQLPYETAKRAVGGRGNIHLQN